MENEDVCSDLSLPENPVRESGGSAGEAYSKDSNAGVCYRNSPGKKRRPWRGMVWVMVAAGSALAAASSQAPGGGNITLRASVIDISSSGITATGSPVLSSEEGRIAAREFSLSLDKDGKASVAAATGGVRFSLAANAGPYRTVSGTCSRVMLYPAEKHAILLGGLAGSLQAPGIAPLTLNGASRADLYGAGPGRSGHFEISSPQPSVITVPRAAARGRG